MKTTFTEQRLLKLMILFVKYYCLCQQHNLKSKINSNIKKIVYKILYHYKSALMVLTIYFNTVLYSMYQVQQLVYNLRKSVNNAPKSVLYIVCNCVRNLASRLH